jgi:RND superfamily putative drug exporter
MAAWTRLVLRYRIAVVVAWAVVLVLGGWATAHLSPLLSNTFTVPGTDSNTVRNVLEEHFGDRPDGSFTVVFKVPDSSDEGLLASLQGTVDEAASAVPTGRATQLVVAGPHVVYGDVVSTLDLAEAKGVSDDLLRAIGQPPGVERAYVTGAGSIQHELDPIFNEDLRKGESIAIPIALLVLLAVFGISASVTIPFVFAACTITGTLGIVYGIAHLAETPTYVTNLVQLIGLGIAVDYSLLIVYRFREELASGSDKDAAIVRTMETAGRSVIFSGLAVALGLALLVAMPLPFMRMMGVAGFLIPIVSIAAAATLQPALLSLYGRRGVARKRILPGEPIDPEKGFWARLARSIMARPVLFLATGAAVLFAAALPAFALQLTPGSTFGIPRSPQSVQGFDLLQTAVGPGAVAPSIVLLTAKSGSVTDPEVEGAVERFVAELKRDPEVAAVAAGAAGRYVDPTKRYRQVLIAGRHDYGFPQAQAFVDRLRGELIPGARFPAGVEVIAGGGPAQGVDFLDRAYTYFPPLIAAVLLLSYVLLMRAFRSLLLPLKAVVLNLLSIGAAYGMLVVVFKWGVGEDVAGLYQFDQVEGWIPIFLFAMLYGLSMDYEVFLVTRMREAWDDGADNATAVAYGLERTGRIITAAAIIMCAAFLGFVAGRIVGLQQFGLGLAVAVLVDATIVRSLLVPSMMRLFDRWNWWLPPWAARIVRVEPSPLGPAPAPVKPAPALLGGSVEPTPPSVSGRRRA